LIDDDPYVKKTAALSVAKIYQIMPEHTKEFGFIKLLQELLQDGNSIVVANAAAALYEISKEAGKNYLKANKETIGKLLNALNETNEWGQIYILESIINYKPKEEKEAEEIIERISPRLQHANPAVVLGATKNILHFLDFIENKTNQDSILKKLSAPLVTLLSAEPEIQYIGLCNILLILQQIPNVFEKNVKMFFCRFSDPIYVKLSKIDVMIAVADSSNVDQIISELHEYCNDIDQDFVRRSVKAIGQVVCKVERIAKKGVEALREHITHEHGSESALQEAVIVACRILRKYPKKFDGLIKDICLQMKRIDEQESKSALIWIIGEYAEKIDDAEGKIQFFVDSFKDEATYVCLQILTAAVKMYIKKPDDCEEMVMYVLKLASEESDNPDLRDRGYIYWRMLSTDPTTTKEVVLAKRPDYDEDLTKLMDAETNEIFIEVGIPKLKGKRAAITPQAKQLSDPEDEEGEDQEVEEEKPKSKKSKDKKKKKKDKDEEEEFKQIEIDEPEVQESKPPTDLDDIFGLGLSEGPTDNNNTSSAVDPLEDIFGSGTSNGNQDGGSAGIGDWGGNDIFGGGSSALAPAGEFIKPQFSEVLNSNTPGQSGSAKGLQINGRFFREGSTIKLEMQVTNSGSNTISDFQIMFNKNSFGVSANTINIVPLSQGDTRNTTVDCNINSNNAEMKNPPTCPYLIQVALKCSLDVFYFQVPCLLHVLLSASPVSVTQMQCQQMASSIGNKNTKSVSTSRFASSPQDLKERLKANSFYHIYDEGNSMIFATQTMNNIPLVVK
jgi:vesicle coat complex subunit